MAKENKSLGKRTEEILTTLFGESLGKIWVARKYSELLRSEGSPLSADVEQYWNDALLLRLAKTIWLALDLPLRGDAKALRFTEGS